MAVLTESSKKFYDYIVKEIKKLKPGQELQLSTAEINKAINTNVTTSNASAIIKRARKDNSELFKNFKLRAASKFNPIYSSNKKFRDFVAADKPNFKFLASQGDDGTKAELYKKFLRVSKATEATKGLIPFSELAKRFDIPTKDITSYYNEKYVDGRVNNSTANFFIKNFKATKGILNGKEANFFKEPSKAIMEEWKTLKSSNSLSKSTVNAVNEINNRFRDQIVTNRQLPDIDKVMKGSITMTTPSRAANAMAIYSRALRGETFRQPLNFKESSAAGVRLLSQLGSTGRFNSYRTAFYNLALDNINKDFKVNGTLKEFKNTFVKELGKAMGIEKTGKIPFNINEIISLSAGEVRGVQPFSVFVDAVDAGINSGALSDYQGQFSTKLGKVQELMATGKAADKAAARLIANSLVTDNKVTLTNKLIKEGFTKSQIKTLNLPEIKIGKDATKTYKAADLTRYKKQSSGAVDIGQFAKDKGYYIDVKKGKPFWESPVNNDIVKLAQNNTGNICNIFKGKVAFSADGGRIGFAGGCAGEMVESLEADSKGTLQKINKTEGVLGTAKNAATRFLTGFKNTGSFKTKVALGAGAVIGGFGGGVLVKQFRNDDPTTYLNNESQMEGMLISDVEEAASKVEDNPILNNQFKLEALAAAGITAPIAKGVYNTQRFGTPQLLETPMELDQEMKTLKRTVRQITHPGGKKAKRIGAAAQETIRMARQRMFELNKYIVETTDPLISSGKGPIRSALGLSGVLGKGLWALTSPIVALPSTAMYIAKDKMEGKSTTDALTNPLTYLAPAFMNQSVKALAKAGASRGLLAIAGMGLAGTAALPAIATASGIAAAGSLGYQAYKKFFDKTTDEDFFNR
jgi:hypothetical protein